MPEHVPAAERESERAMKEYVYVVLSNPVTGREDEYNRWYSERHLADVMAVPGFVSARRYRIADPKAEVAPEQSYMALYNMRTDDPEGLVDQLRELVRSEEQTSELQSLMRIS